jgi:hypothetical protein
MGYALGLACSVGVVRHFKKTNFMNRIPLQGLDQLGNSTLEH